VTTVILAANGYPNNYIKGDEIENLSEEIDTKIFHAGTKNLEDKILSNGGRVLACTGFGENINEALNNSYKIAKKISWKNKYFRNDIGKDLM
jgi:phosphoribosylamine--glycine ligase